MGVNGILLLDKDEGWTSQDCVSKLRGILGERRIGHAGTLDPLATGLLVVLVGRATRAAAFAEAETKEYVAAFRPGIVTDTQDITGNLLRSSDVLPSEEDVRAALPRFTGEIEQIPPMYSAIKINGRKLYDIARRGGARVNVSHHKAVGEQNFGKVRKTTQMLHEAGIPATHDVYPYAASSTMLPGRETAPSPPQCSNKYRASRRSAAPPVKPAIRRLRKRRRSERKRM